MKLETPLHTVTFDCWETLIFQPDPDASGLRRADLLARIARSRGHRISVKGAGAALEDGWLEHVRRWRSGFASGAPQIVASALERLGVRDPEISREVAAALQLAALEDEVQVLEGARGTLEWLAARGIRRALVCDTGFTPGRVVRQLLDRVGLLELLQAVAFSDEVGVPKPDARIFRAALEPLGAQPAGAVHVGDLRGTDIAGARAVGMGSVRLRWRHDDGESLPDGDAVADSHAHLLEILARSA